MSAAIVAPPLVGRRRSKILAYRKWLPIVSAAVLAVLIYGYMFHISRIAFRSNPDFSCFYRAGRMLLGGRGSDIYNLAAEQAFDESLKSQVAVPGRLFYTLPFVFTPPTLLVFAPLAALPYQSADLVWLIMNVAILIAVPIFVSTALGLGTGGTCAAVFLPSIFPPTMWAIAEGQISIILLGIFSMLFVSLYRNRNFEAGCWIALTAIKPQFTLPALIIALAGRNWKAIRGVAATSLGLLLISFYFVGWRSTLGFPATILSYSRLPVGLNGQLGEHPLDMPNIRGICYNIFVSPVSREVWVALATAICLLLLWATYRASDVTRWFSALLVVTLLVSYHVYPHDMALLAITVPLLAYSARSTGWTPGLALLASTEFACLLIPFVWHTQPQLSETYAVWLVAILVQTCAPILCGRCLEIARLGLRGVGLILGSSQVPHDDGHASIEPIDGSPD